MLIFRDKLPASNRSAIEEKINSISAYLGIDPNWLMAVINFESAGSFSPSIQNPHTNATGLIQFMPATAISLGTTVEELKQMTFLQQLDYVKKYYAPYRGKLTGFVDLYLATFYPIAMGKPDSYVIGSHKGRGTVSAIAQQNPVFDPFGTGMVTVGAIKKALILKIPADYTRYVISENSGKIMIWAAVIVLTSLYFLTKKK